MAYVIIESKDTCKLVKIVFKNMSLAQAKTIAEHMNNINKNAAEKTGKIIKLFYRAIGK